MIVCPVRAAPLQTITSVFPLTPSLCGRSGRALWATDTPARRSYRDPRALNRLTEILTVIAANSDWVGGRSSHRFNAGFLP